MISRRLNGPHLVFLTAAGKKSCSGLMQGRFTFIINTGNIDDNLACVRGFPVVPMVYQYRSRFYQWYHW